MIKNKLIYTCVLVLLLSSCASTPKIVNIPTVIPYTPPKLIQPYDYPTLSPNATAPEFVHYCVVTVKQCKAEISALRHQCGG